MYPNKKQKKLLRQWLGTTRYVYNRALHSVKTGENKCSFGPLRNRFVTYKRSGVINTEIQEWELETPKDIRAECIRDLEKAFKVAIKNLKLGNISRFNMRYRKKKTYQSIVIPKSTISIKDKKVFLYKTYIGDGFKVSKDCNVTQFEYDCRIQYKYDEWYLLIPTKVSIRDEEEKKENVASLDPGVRTFQTIYSENHSIKIQHNPELLRSLQEKLDLFQSLRSKKLISKSHYTRRINRIYKRLDNLIDDLHFKTIHFLEKHYNWILLPIFESQEMAMKGRNRKCNRNMMQLKHFKFKERLKAKCNISKTCLTIVDESYTSKTCGRCGHINNIGSSKVFKCNSCSLVCDRDLNGARNILLKHICSK
jgi:putative transposase